VAFVALALYLLAQSTVALATGHRADDSPGGIIWTAVTAVLMFALAAEKGRVGRALGNAALETEGRVTFIDGVLAASVLVGIALDAFVGWWWADAAVGYLIVFYATREAVHIFREDRSAAG
jgi:divalent metal cation (Fe/Co/Zn/Cd) transporter